MNAKFWAILPLAVLTPPDHATTIVAAESAYADIARQVAGPATPVIAILKNPATDPHAYEPTPSVARAVANARIVIENGIGYDPWMDRLLAASQTAGQTIIVAAALLHRHPGENPHLWYDPATMRLIASAVQGALQTTGTPERYRQTLASLATLQARIDALHEKFAGTPVAATEPVFGPMIAALGLVDTHARFETSVMNGSEPRATDVAGIEQDLKSHRVRALITNAQATDTEAARLADLARAEKIPLVPITETLPPGQTYQQWITAELSALQTALAATAPTE